LEIHCVLRWFGSMFDLSALQTPVLSDDPADEGIGRAPDVSAARTPLEGAHAGCPTA
jgi:hypothetical protein